VKSKERQPEYKCLYLYASFNYLVIVYNLSIPNFYAAKCSSILAVFRLYVDAFMYDLIICNIYIFNIACVCAGFNLLFLIYSYTY
jgi:hypothetical protein